MKGICQFTCDGAFESQVLELVVFYTGATEGCFLLHKMTHTCMNMLAIGPKVAVSSSTFYRLLCSGDLLWDRL